MNNMKDLNNKTFIATVCTMVILCIVCQFTALQLLKPNDKNKQSLAQENAAISGSETAATSSTEAPNDSNKRKLKLKYRKLRRLENQSDFLEFTSKELEIVTLFKKQHGNSSYYDSIVIAQNYYIHSLRVDLHLLRLFLDFQNFLHSMNYMY